MRTDLGREIVDRMIKAGVIISRPADSDEKAMKLLRTLSIVSRRRWPGFAEPSVERRRAAAQEEGRRGALAFRARCRSTLPLPSSSR